MRLKTSFQGPVTVQIYVNGKGVPLPPHAIRRDKHWYDVTFDTFAEFLNMVSDTQNYAVIHVVGREVQVYVGEDDF